MQASALRKCPAYVLLASVSYSSLNKVARKDWWYLVAEIGELKGRNEESKKSKGGNQEKVE